MCDSIPLSIASVTYLEQQKINNRQINNKFGFQNQTQNKYINSYLFTNLIDLKYLIKIENIYYKLWNLIFTHRKKNLKAI